MSFERIYSHIIERAPHLAPKNTYAIWEWLSSGFDTDKDILPTIDFVCKRGVNNIKGFGWFTMPIKQAHQKRITSQATQSPKTESDAQKAKRIAWHRKTGIQSAHFGGEKDLLWLENYEQQNGRVE